MTPFVPKKTVWNGIEYPSLQAAAQACKVDYSTMWARLRNGYTCDDDVIIGSHKRRTCTWNGVTYPSVAAAARANYISSPGMWARLRRGHTCDDDLR